ncbi:MAG: PEP-CTERM system TPR-repeat protein PrsT [Betaproteobacteria bacterium]|nr:PEP-CTERM system TPR-repeat protein PrsT [Betaproteobacteria bacterium]
MNTRCVSRMQTFLAMSAFVVLAGCSSEKDEPYFELGQQALQRHDYAGAVIQFKNAVKRAPEAAEPHFFLGLALRQSVATAEAEIEFRRAMKLGMDAERVVPELGDVLVESGKAEEALQLIDRLDTTSAAMAVLKGNAFLATDRTADARAVFGRVLSRDRDNAAARVGLARVVLAEGDSHRALEMLDDILRAAPDAPNASFVRANILTGAGKLAEAADAYGKAITARPGELRAYTALVPILLALDDTKAASERVAQLRRLAPATPATYYLAALVALHTGDVSQARELIRLVLKAVPDDLRALLLAGTIELEEGRPELAEKHLSRLVTLARSEAEPRRLLATAHLRLGRPDRAMTVIEPLLSGASVDASTLVVAADALAASGNTANAIDSLRKAVALDPANSRAETRLGQLLASAGKAGEGLSHLERGVELAPGNASAAEALVRELLRLRRPDEAQKRIDHLIAAFPKKPEFHRLSAIVMLARSDRTGARNALEAALSVTPGYFPAIRDLARLDVDDGEIGSAKTRYTRALASQPRNEEAALLLAGLLERTNAAHEEVVGVLDRAILANAESVSLRIAKINYLSRTGRKREAIEAAQTAQAALPAEPAVLLSLARSQQLGGDLGQALASYGKLPPLMPDSEIPYLGAAEIHAQRGEYALARSSIEQAIRVQPRKPALYVALVDVDVRAKAYDRALADARDVQKRWPGLAGGYAAEAQVHAAMGDYAAAQQVLRAALARVPDDGLFNRLVALLAVQNQLDAAELEVERWTKAHPASTAPMTFIAQLRSAHGEHDRAVRWYRRVLDSRPNDPVAMSNLARALGQARDPAAMSIAKRALVIAPRNGVVLDTLGVLSAQSGDLARAISYFEQAVAVDPNAAATRVHLARLLMQVDRKQDAKVQLEAASRVATDGPLAREISSLIGAL